MAIGVGKKLIEYRVNIFFKMLIKDNSIYKYWTCRREKGNHALGDVFIINKINDKKIIILIFLIYYLNTLPKKQKSQPFTKKLSMVEQHLKV